jgi:hypothetical protein
MSCAMDLFKVHEVQTLVNALHEYLEYQQCLKQFLLAENKHKEWVKQQRLGFVAKGLWEFNIANTTILEGIKWDWNLTWHIVNDEKRLPPNE